MTTNEKVKAAFVAYGPMTILQAGTVTGLGSEKARTHVKPGQYYVVAWDGMGRHIAQVWALEEDDEQLRSRCTQSECNQR